VNGVQILRYLNVAAVSLNQTPLDWDHNKSNILNALNECRAAKIELICYPELCITGYGCEDMFFSISTCQMAISMLHEIALETHGMIVSVGLPLLYRDGLYNTACLMVDGEIIGFVAKQNLAGSGVYYEPRWFRPWPAGMKVDINLNGKQYPLGDLIFEVGDVRIGFEICEDAWVAVRTGVNLAQRGVDIILNPSASHFAFGKNQIRKRFVLEGARAFNVAYLYANLLGNEAGRLIYDGDTLIAVNDQLLAEGPRFSFEEFIMTEATIDIQTLRMQRTLSANFPKTSNHLNNRVKVPFHSALHRNKHEIPKKMPSKKGAWETSVHIKEEEFGRAVALGLFDYLRKSRSFGFVLNLSGGADSAACACLIYLMIHLGLTELGSLRFRQKLSYLFPSVIVNPLLATDPVIANPEPATDPVIASPLLARGEAIQLNSEDYLKQLLFCLYQETENNSETTKSAAKSLAESLGFPLASFSVNTLVEEYKQLIEPLLNRPLNWEEDDFALQNIQSRVRTPSAWLLANIKRSLLLCTSNRSEASTGYTTMDGDAAGGLAPLAGIDKHFILQWLKWLETESVLGIGPLPILKLITEQSPTAELRPSLEGQTDEMDLMPYPVLDTIERLFVLDKRSPLEIFSVLKETRVDIPIKQLAMYIERFFTLWSQNQWKRERLAPSFHLDDESVDPKTWCRFPILSGNFKKELTLMWRYVESL